jgi:ribosomal protein S18 acetylase RimI-like enzyme
MKLLIKALQYRDIEIINKWNIKNFKIDVHFKNNKFMGADGSFPYCAFFNDSIFGYTEFYYDMQNYINISIAINPIYQNKKLGKYFLKNIINYIKENKLTTMEEIRIWVEVDNTRALNLYKNFGFLPMKDFIYSLDAIPLYYNLRRSNELP